jgi:hypothetical protein
VARARVALLPDLPIGVGATPGGGAPQPFTAPPQQAPPQQAPGGTGAGQIRNASATGGAQQFGGQ